MLLLHNNDLPAAFLIKNVLILLKKLSTLKIFNQGIIS